MAKNMVRDIGRMTYSRQYLYLCVSMMFYVIFMKLPLFEMCGFTILAPVLKGSSKNTPFFSPYFVITF